MDRDAVDERGDHPRLADRARTPVEQVAIEDDEIRRLPDLDRADLGLEVVDAGRPVVNPASASTSAIRSSGRNGGFWPRWSSLTRVTATSIWSNGSAVETLQSEPIARVAPAASNDPNGYCQPVRSGPRNGIVSASIWSSCTAQ